MTDREFLCSIHERLTTLHYTSPLLDFMHRFRAIISKIPRGTKTEITIPYNSLEELKRALHKGGIG